MEDKKFIKILALSIIAILLIAYIAVPNVNIFSNQENLFSVRASNISSMAPNTPSKPSGEISGITCTEYNYSTSAVDPEGLNISYGWDWNGDLAVDEWTDFYQSGEICNASHFWWQPGEYNISVKAKNEMDNESDWSESLNVTMINLPPFIPTNPDPRDGNVSEDLDLTLSWNGGDPNGCDTVTYDVYFGQDHPPIPKVASNISTTEYDVDSLNLLTLYSWQIIAWDNHSGKTEGDMWSFTTRGNNPPNTPGSPTPSDEATNVDVDTDLSWECIDPDGDELTFDVYLEADNPLPTTIVSNDQTGKTYTPESSLLGGTQYYWKIVAKDVFGNETEGPVWSFTTEVPEELVVTIENPKEKYLHLGGSPIFPLILNTIVIGDVNLNVSVSPSENVDKVELYVNGAYKETDDTPPYSFEWSPFLSFRYNIEVKAYDTFGRNATDNLTILKWRLHPAILIAGSLFIAKQMIFPTKRTVVRGTVLNLKRVGKTYHGRAIRLHYTEFSGLTRTSGVIKLQRISFKHGPMLRKFDIGPLGLTTFIAGVIPGGIK